MNPHVKYTKEQMASLLRTAKTRGYPVDRMNWASFLAYIKRVDPALLSMISPIHTLALISTGTTKNRQASLLFDSLHLFWQEQGNSASWAAYSGNQEFIDSAGYSVEAQKRPFKGPIPEGTYIAPQARYHERPDDM